MNYAKIIFCCIITTSAILTGCSNRNQIGKLSSDIQILNGKINQLSNDIQSLHSDIQATKCEAIRANQRLDNQVSKYKK